MRNSVIQGKALEIEDNNNPTPQLDINILPTVIGDYVKECSEVMQQPKEFIAISSLTALAGLLGNKVAININDSIFYPMLWGMLIGDSGTGKTPSIREAIKPIKELDKQSLNQYKKEILSYKNLAELIKEDIEFLKLQRRKTKDAELKQSLASDIEKLKASAPIEPFSREIYINGGTKEAVATQIATKSPNGILIEIDELMDWLETITKSDRREEQRLYIEGFNNNSSKTITIGRGTEYIENLNISIIGGVQTRRYYNFLDSYKGSGLVPRFQMLAISKSNKRVYSDKTINNDISIKYTSLFERLRAITERTEIINGNEIATAPPKEYFYSKEAKEVFIDWFNANETKKHNSNQNDLKVEYLGKTTNTFHSLALIFHLSENNSSNYISEVTANKVVNFIYYLYECAKYLFEDESIQLIEIAKEILEKQDIIVNWTGGKFTKAKIRASTNAFKKHNKDELYMAIDYLVEKNYIKMIEKTSKAEFYSFTYT